MRPKPGTGWGKVVTLHVARPLRIAEQGAGETARFFQIVAPEIAVQQREFFRMGGNVTLQKQATPCVTIQLPEPCVALDLNPLAQWHAKGDMRPVGLG